MFACMPFMHVIMGLLMVTGNFFEGRPGFGPTPFMGWMLVIMGTVFILLGWSLAVCILIAGRKLKRRKNRLFCMVVAGIECAFTPFGTVLGVFTLVILSKDSVKEIFVQPGTGAEGGGL